MPSGAVGKGESLVSKATFLCVALAAIVLLAFGAIWALHALMGKRPYSEPWQPTMRARAEVAAACEAHVEAATTKAREAIRRRSQEFRDFIDSRKAGAKPFAEDMVSLYGKWRALSPYLPRLCTDKDGYHGKWHALASELSVTGHYYLPCLDKDGHKKYVIDKFDQHLFRIQDLTATMQRSIEGMVRDLEQVENELAVALRQEIIGHSFAPDDIPVAAQEFKQAVERLISASQWDAAKSAGGLVVSEVVASVATQVLLRMGVSAGILTAGAANSWWSFGGSLVIGLLVDVMWEWVDDPAGDIEREMVAALDDIAAKGADAIRDEMAAVLEVRQKLWAHRVEQLLL
jgi:hypothetical protein